MPENNQNERSEPERFISTYQPANTIVYSDITGMVALIQACFKYISSVHKKEQIKKLLSAKDWYEIHKEAKTGRRVLSSSAVMEHEHEKVTAIILTRMNYDVIFVPTAMFNRAEKRYDVLLLRDTIILKADLKCIHSKNPDTIGKRIKEGADQAPRVVLHICSDIPAKNLIGGLRSGSYKNELLKEILLIYRNKFYTLPKNLITSNRIFELLK